MLIAQTFENTLSEARGERKDHATSPPSPSLNQPPNPGVLQDATKREYGYLILWF